MTSPERIARATETIAICIAHVAVAYIGSTYNRFRANDLIDALSSRLDWQIRRVEG